MQFYLEMDLPLINERIRALTETRDACNCQSRQGRQLRAIADMLLESYENLRQNLLRAIADEFLLSDCEDAN